MEIGVRKYSVDASAHRAQLGHAALLDGDPAGEVLVAVEQAGGPVQRVSRVVDGRTFLNTILYVLSAQPGAHLSPQLWYT